MENLPLIFQQQYSLTTYKINISAWQLYSTKRKHLFLHYSKLTYRPPALPGKLTKRYKGTHLGILFTQSFLSHDSFGVPLGLGVKLAGSCLCWEPSLSWWGGLCKIWWRLVQQFTRELGNICTNSHFHFHNASMTPQTQPQTPKPKWITREKTLCNGKCPDGYPYTFN